MADDAPDPTLLQMLQDAYGPTDPNYEVNPGAGNPLMDFLRRLPSSAQRTPYEWTKYYPGLAKTLADTINYGGMAIRSSGGAGMARDAVMSHALNKKALDTFYKGGDFDPGITGGSGLDTSIMTGGRPKPGSAGDLAGRPGVDEGMADPRSQFFDPAANDVHPRESIPANHVGGRFQQALDHGGKPPTVELGLLPAGDYPLDQLPPSYRNAFDLMDLIEAAVRRNPNLMKEPPPNLTLLPGGRKD